MVGWFHRSAVRAFQLLLLLACPAVAISPSAALSSTPTPTHTRHPQVLPSRTHPHMTCTGTGGFVLSGIKVVSPDATPLGAQLARAQSGAAGGQQGQGEGEEEAGAGAQRGGGGGGGGWGRRGEDKEAAAGGEEGDRRQVRVVRRLVGE